MTSLQGAAGQVPAAPAAGHEPRFRRVLAALRASETATWRIAARVAVFLPLGALLFAIAVLAIKAVPAMRVNGGAFFTGSHWKIGSAYAATVHTDGVAHPEGSTYGAWPLIAGTLQTSFIAVLLAVPISVGCAFALTERLPRWISRPLGFAIELLAGIPSVVIGLWGVLTLGPVFARHIYPIIGNHMPDVPVLKWFRGPVGQGQGLLTGALVLTLMIVPIITATTADLFRQVPSLPKEGGEALGMTDYEVASRVTLRWVRSGIIGATVLGLGRALGETIALALTVGAIFQVSPNIYSPMTTVAVTIVTQLDSAETDATGFAISSIAEIALVLAVISVLVNLGARWIVRRSSRLGGPVGRGA
jgi:phosphate transport system permease protein